MASLEVVREFDEREHSLRQERYGNLQAELDRSRDGGGAEPRSLERSAGDDADRADRNEAADPDVEERLLEPNRATDGGDRPMRAVLETGSERRLRGWEQLAGQRHADFTETLWRDLDRQPLRFAHQ